MNNKIKIEKITILIGKKVISLTPDEAKELQLQLNNLIGEQRITWYPYYTYSDVSVYAD